MQRLVLSLLLLLSLINPVSVFAHPMDETDVYLYFDKDAKGQEISEGTIPFEVALNWLQVSLLVQQQIGDKVIQMQELRTFALVYIDFVVDHLTIGDEFVACELKDLRLGSEEEVGPINLGVRIFGHAMCGTPAQTVEVRNSMFEGASNTQSNRIHFMNGTQEMQASVTTINLPVVYFNTETQQITSELANNSVLEENVPITDATVAQLDGASPWLVLLLVFILGLLHTLEAGHSKTILTSAMVHKSMSLKNGLTYALVFTVTHIADIVLLGVLFLVVGNVVDLYGRFSQLQEFSIYAFLLIGLYLFVKELSHLIQHKTGVAHHDHEHTHDHNELVLDKKHSLREQLMVGFVTGLAPCIFGWSVFMLILTTYSLWLVIPAILSFGAGIFLALSSIVFLLSRAKKVSYKRLAWFTEYTPILSSLLMLGYAVYLLMLK